MRKPAHVYLREGPYRFTATTEGGVKQMLSDLSDTGAEMPAKARTVALKAFRETIGSIHVHLFHEGWIEYIALVVPKKWSSKRVPLLERVGFRLDSNRDTISRWILEPR